MVELSSLEGLLHFMTKVPTKIGLNVTDHFGHTSQVLMAFHSAP